MPTDTASGAIASFPDGQNVFPLKSCVVQINPIQDTSGGDPSPSNICPISGWNSVEVIDDPTYGGFINWNQLLKSTNDSDTNRGVSFSRNPSTGLFTLSGTSTTTYTSLFSSFTAIKDHIYCGIANLVTNPNNVSFKVAALNINWGSGNMKKNNTTQTTSVGFLGFSANTNFTGITGYFHILDLTEIFGATKADEILAMETNQSGSGVAYVKSIFPNDYYAYNAGTKTNASAVNGTPYLDYTTALGQTVYGGTLDVVSGVLTVDKVIVDLGDLNWDYSSGIFINYTSGIDLHTNERGGYMLSDRYAHCGVASAGNMPNYSIQISGGVSASNMWVKNPDYTDKNTFKTAMSGAKVVYELADAYKQTIQLTPTQVQTLLGTNNIFADSGDVSVEYIADIQGYIDKQ